MLPASFQGNWISFWREVGQLWATYRSRRFLAVADLREADERAFEN
jgi:hypothetical protein